MLTYPQIPRDAGGAPLQEFAIPKPALARYTSENASASSVISFTHNTQTVEVAAVGGAAVVKWIATSDTTASVISAVSGANYDNVVSANTVRRFVVPIETIGTGASSIVGINRQNGLYQRMAIKTVGVASIMTTEY